MCLLLKHSLWGSERPSGIFSYSGQISVWKCWHVARRKSTEGSLYNFMFSATKGAYLKHPKKKAHKVILNTVSQWKDTTDKTLQLKQYSYVLTSNTTPKFLEWVFKKVEVIISYVPNVIHIYINNVDIRWNLCMNIST